MLYPLRSEPCLHVLALGTTGNLGRQTPLSASDRDEKGYMHLNVAPRRIIPRFYAEEGYPADNFSCSKS